MAHGQPLRRAPVQARAKERLERVLTAAEQLFAEVGFEAATTNQIAERADTSIGSIYEFLGSKQGIAQALATRYLAEFARLYDEAGIDPAADGKGAVIGTLVDLVEDFYLRHPGLGPLLGSCQGSEDLQATRRALCTALIDPIDGLIARHHASDPERRRVVAELCAGILWTVVGEVALQAEQDRRLLLDELKVMLTTYVAVALPAA